MTHDELIEYGCVYCTADDAYGETHSGYWVPGDGDGAGYGHFLGTTPAAATAAILG